TPAPTASARTSTGTRRRTARPVTRAHGPGRTTGRPRTGISPHARSRPDVLTTWMLVAVGAGFLATAVVPGIWLWWPARGDASSRSDLGVALMTGTLVAFSVLVVQVLYESRASRVEAVQRDAQVTRDHRLQQQAERQSLALAVGMQHDLRELDLRGRNLSGFFLVRKQLQEAQLSGARLDESVLTG